MKVTSLVQNIKQISEPCNITKQRYTTEGMNEIQLILSEKTQTLGSNECNLTTFQVGLCPSQQHNEGYC